MKIYNLPFYGQVYRFVMRLAHRFNWHYAPPIYPDGDTQLWCKWCGFRETIKRRNGMGLKSLSSPHPKPEEVGK